MLCTHILAYYFKNKLRLYGKQNLRFQIITNWALQMLTSVCTAHQDDHSRKCMSRWGTELFSCHLVLLMLNYLEYEENTAVFPAMGANIQWINNNSRNNI
jgi:hypothetical protein